MQQELEIQQSSLAVAVANSKTSLPNLHVMARLLKYVLHGLKQHAAAKCR